MKSPVGKIIKDQGLLEGLKIQEDLSKLLKELHSDLIEAMLHDELDAHLGYSKNEKNDSNNACNGSTSKRLKSEHGETIISVPCDSDGSFESIVVPKHQSKTIPSENVVILFTLKG
ncbi:transposase [Flavobacterium sp. I3-2]|uniref:transposase n=1 Tax=Flavobacterium sp. I3-2 TaxID=2748319 RepID=UPI00293BD1AF|nr:transposase [Flavobacterium sp. I3-2]